MAWSADAPNLGFSTGEPWLPAGASHRSLAVDQQEGRDGSTLDFTRKCLALRKRQPAFRTGSMRIIEASEALLVFDRAVGGQHLRCTFNLSEDEMRYGAGGKVLLTTGHVEGGGLGPYAAVIEEIA